MKKIAYISFVLSVLLWTAGCQDGYIDSISTVDPGEDTEAPVISIEYPDGDITIPFTDSETDIEFEFLVTDDIELDGFTVTLDGAELGSYSDFKDYRIAMETELKTVEIGEHTLVVNASDLSGKTATASLDFEVTNKYTAKYDGEIFYMPFEGGLFMDLISETSATVVGDPTFGDGLVLDAYQGAVDSYLTFPTAGLLSDEFSAVFWMKVNADPTRAGILIIGPEDTATPDAQNNRTSGFRFFREGSETAQIFKLNAANGTADSWFDGGSAATVDPSAGDWVHFAFTIAADKCVVYLNGEVAKEGEFTGIDWTGCDIMSIMSGAPRFTGWSHLYDASLLDELRLFNKALTQEEISTIIANEQ